MIRWHQWGAFCSIYRTHGHRVEGLQDGEGASNEIWHFGEVAEAAITVVMRTRELLRSYIHTLFQEAAESGAAISRPLLYDFPEDAVAQLVDDQLMLGPRFMVAPVLSFGRTSRTRMLTTSGDLFKSNKKQMKDLVI